MSLRIATAPVSWGIFETEAGRWHRSYNEVLDEMVEAGYAGTELGPYGFLPTDPRQLQAELSSRGLHLVSAFVPIPLGDPDRHAEGVADALRVADLLAACGARLIVLADSMTPRRRAIAGRVADEGDGLSDEQWERAADVLTEIARACARRGLRTAFHHHAATFVETPGEIARLLSLVEPDVMGLCLDTGHYVYGGGNPEEAVKRYGSRIWHLHVKDVHQTVLEAVRYERVEFLDAVRRGVFCELGQGMVNIPAVLAALARVGYDGWVVVEQDVDVRQPGVDPLASARRSRAYLRTIVGQ